MANRRRGALNWHVCGAIGLVLAAIALSGCAPAQRSEASPSARNIDAWTMPLDEFTYTASPLRDYAEALLEKPCYEQHGIDWPVPWRPSTVGQGDSYSAGMQRIFNLDLASKFGYHRAPNVYDGMEEWKSFVEKTTIIAETTPGFERVMDKCQRVSRDALPLPPDDDMNYAISAASIINDEALASVAVVSAGQAWASCMAGRGYAGMAPEPQEAPGDILEEEWKIGYPGTVASQDEIDMAKADASCLQSSGWSQAFYDEVWDRQAQFVDKNADRLARIKQTLLEDQERMLNVVAENAPSD